MNSGHTTIDVYNFILEWAVAHKGNTPTQRQVAEGCGVSSGTAHHHIQVLIKRGVLERIDGALCVTKSTFRLQKDAANLDEEPLESRILNMRIIPRAIQGITTRRLKELGIRVGPEMDNQFRPATYPEGWKYEPLSGDEDSYLLIDPDERYVGLFHEIDGTPTFTYMMEA